MIGNDQLKGKTILKANNHIIMQLNNAPLDLLAVYSNIIHYTEIYRKNMVSQHLNFTDLN